MPGFAWRLPESRLIHFHRPLVNQIPGSGFFKRQPGCQGRHGRGLECMPRRQVVPCARDAMLPAGGENKQSEMREAGFRVYPRQQDPEAKPGTSRMDESTCLMRKTAMGRRRFFAPLLCLERSRAGPRGGRCVALLQRRHQQAAGSSDGRCWLATAHGGCRAAVGAAAAATTPAAGPLAGAGHRQRRQPLLRAAAHAALKTEALGVVPPLHG